MHFTTLLNFLHFQAIETYFSLLQGNTRHAPCDSSSPGLQMIDHQNKQSEIFENYQNLKILKPPLSFSVFVYTYFQFSDRLPLLKLEN